MPVTADTYQPFDAGAGADVAEAGWRAMARHWLPSGPLITDLAPADWDVLEPSAGAGLQVLVEPGEAWIRGHYAEWETQAELTISANASGQTRVDAVVARVDFVNNDIELDIVAGTPGAGIPALTQSSSVWEILLGSSTLLTGGSSVTVADLRSCVGYSAQAWTPTSVRFGSNSASISNATGRVIRQDGMVTVRAYFDVDSVASGSFNMALPVPMKYVVGTNVQFTPVGSALARETGLGSSRHGVVYIEDTSSGLTHAYFADVAEGSGAVLFWDQTEVTTAHSVRVQFTYEAAN